MITFVFMRTTTTPLWPIPSRNGNDHCVHYAEIHQKSLCCVDIVGMQIWDTKYLSSATEIFLPEWWVSPFHYMHYSEVTWRSIRLEPSTHDDVINWKHFPRYGPFVRGIHRSPVNSPHKGQWGGALMFSLIWTYLNGWAKHSRGWWFETLSRPLLRHCNEHDAWHEVNLRTVLLSSPSLSFGINIHCMLYYVSQSLLQISIF